MPLALSFSGRGFWKAVEQYIAKATIILSFDSIIPVRGLSPRVIILRKKQIPRVPIQEHVSYAFTKALE